MRPPRQGHAPGRRLRGVQRTRTIEGVTPIEAIDTHTAGEPTRIVTGIGPIRGATMAEQRDDLRAHFDMVRRALVLEPRGHDAMVLAFLTPPVSANAHRGVVFANDAGYLGMCGHGAIGVATWLVRHGHVPAVEPVTEIALDTPAGQILARVKVENGRPRSVAIQNVPSFVQEQDRIVGVPGIGKVRADIAYGGNWFAFVRGGDVGIPVELRRLDDLMTAAFAIRDALAGQEIAGIDPETGARARIEHVKIWTEEDAAGGPAARALTLCPGRAYDRSPCGTGTSAKLALLRAQGALAPGETFVSRSILGTEFQARVLADTVVAGRPAVVPEIEGSAWVTGSHTFELDEDDPLAHGIERGSER